MKSLVLLTCVFAANAAAQSVPQSAQQTPSPQSSSEHDMAAMDHAKMGHKAAAPDRKPAPPKTPPASGAKNPAQTDHAGHATTMTPPQAVEPERKTEQGSQAAGHAGHALQPLSTPAAQPQAAPNPAPGIDHSAMGHGTPAPQAGTETAVSGMPPSSSSMSSGQGMQMGPMQGGNPPPNARDPNAYNEGARFANLGNHEMNDNAPFWKVLLDKAEAAKGDGERGQNVELEAWYGNDYHKVWMKVEGERRGGALESARTELLWDRAFATFWSTQLGVRHDSGEGGSRDWLAFGVQGLAPYWFETEATAYWRAKSGMAARLNAKYEVLFTPRLILEPEVGGNLYSREDPERGTGKGLSDISASLRLRYEVTRQFAPYVGATWSRQFGGTADYTRARGGRRSSVQAVAGVRFWF